MATQTQTQPGSTTRLRIPATDLAMLLVVLIWGANFSVVKSALGEIPPLAFAALRFLIAGVLLFGLMVWREGLKPLPKGMFRNLLWIGLIGNSLYQVAFTLGLKYTGAANAALLIATTPALVALFGAMFGIERLRRNTIFGIILAIGGVVLVLLARGLYFSAEGLLGDALLLGCAIAWTIYTLGVRTLATGLSPLAITTWTMITGLPALLLFGSAQILSLDWAAINPGAWVGLAYSSVLALVVAYVLWNNSVRVAGSNRTAIYGCAIPLVAALVAWPTLGEIPVPLQGVGAVLIIAGVLLTRR